MSIEITHTAAEGTLVHGTTRGDGTNTILKTAGFRWFRTVGAWGIPSSRDRQPNLGKIERAAAALRAAGHPVSVDIDSTHRCVADAEADRTQRQEDRADALAAKADRRAAAAETAWEAGARASAAVPPGGEPIKIGHHSEQRHRKSIERAQETLGRAVQATDAATEAARRAQVAAAGTAHRHNPVTVKNRIDKLEAEQRADERTRDGHRRVVARTANATYVDEFGPATGTYREQILARIAQRADEITYWKDIYAAQQTAGIATSFGPDTIAKGDRIKYRSGWYPVVRVNAKTVSVQSAPGETWTHKVPYHEISDHRPGGSQVHSA
ncbi:DUF3560 domain-containing protein (plasmid) [Mycolicibacterium fluoranthenivorans]|uniref:DUF3560 domain-containing protein n=1 Tax=Mycolicibacterium fluoranthenivorans TaxID=258505 RepID=A0A7G8PQF2_9MYCO|nr:DUF3560 domain-containing protein [Mycolicibacterium fluoranthenivorans]QNJ96568.1 DUF3560 domain-containing protein [Mycolicibacterium fluoranthenivorans]